MLSAENTVKCRKILERNGQVLQMMKVSEECAELSQAVCKILEEPLTRDHSPERIEANQENFKEEVVDVLVVATQAVMIAGLSEEEINRRAKEKLDKELNKPH